MEIYGNKNIIDLEKLNRQLPPEYQQDDPIVIYPHNTILDIAIQELDLSVLLYLYIY